jgi:hypothetical protein
VSDSQDLCGVAFCLAAQWRDVLEVAGPFVVEEEAGAANAICDSAKLRDRLLLVVELSGREHRDRLAAPDPHERHER